MFKLFVIAALVAVAVAAPGALIGSPVAYTAPAALTYSAYSAPLAYNGYAASPLAYSAPYAYKSAAYVSPYASAYAGPYASPYASPYAYLH